MSETFTFERRLDARLIISVVALGLMGFVAIASETAMNVIFPNADAGIWHSNIHRAVGHNCQPVDARNHHSNIILADQTL